jgi:acetyl esterase/lipase
MKKIFSTLLLLLCLHLLPALPFPDIRFTVEFDAPRSDSAGNYLGGSEILWLVPHQGKLFAGTGFWREEPAVIKRSGAAVLVKRRSGGEWELFHSFGPEYLRVDALASLSFTTDAEGRKLDEPVSILAAGVSDRLRPSDVTVWTFPPGAEEELAEPAVLETDVPLRDAYVRQLFSYKDPETGVHYAFAAAASGALYRAALHRAAAEPGAGYRLQWEKEPELPAHPKSVRIHSWTVANGDFYISRGVVPGEPGAGGLFRRRNGSRPSWELIWEWDLDSPSDKPGLRGITAVPAAPGEKRQVIIGALESSGRIYRIDPEQETAQVEFDFKRYFTEEWGSLGGAATIAAYNDMTAMVNPFDTGEEVLLIGLWINHPQRSLPPYNGSRLLIRHEDGAYEVREIFDPAVPVPPGEELRGARSIALSPFPEEAGRVFYVGGFDAGGAGRKHETAWIYRGEIAAGSEYERPASLSRVSSTAGKKTTERYRILPGVPEDLNSLDIYTQEGFENRPVIVYVHGGGWHQGDKKNIREKDTFFLENGYVFVSVNYRLSPPCPPCDTDNPDRIKHPAHVEDTAYALRWVYDHIAEYGGDPNRIVLCGHSAGAHLVSLIGTNERFLNRAGLVLRDLAGVISLDSAAFDLPWLLEVTRIEELYTNCFGEEAAVLEDASPALHIEAGKDIPPFLLIHQQRELREEINVRFQAPLEEAGIYTERYGFPYSHAQINALVGGVDGEYNRIILDFLETVLRSR